MPSKEEMINNGQYEYNLPNQNLGLIEPIIHISGEKIWDDDRRLRWITSKFYWNTNKKR